MPTGISTGAWIAPGRGALAAMRGWQVLPDYVSVNLHEDDAEDGGRADAGARHRRRGRPVDPRRRQRFAGSRLPRYSLRALVEMTSEDPEAAEAEAEAVLATLRGAGVTLPLLLHGEGGSVWPMVRMAASLGLATRVGFEDGHPARRRARRATPRWSPKRRASSRAPASAGGPRGHACTATYAPDL